MPPGVPVAKNEKTPAKRRPGADRFNQKADAPLPDLAAEMAEAAKRARDPENPTGAARAPEIAQEAPLPASGTFGAEGPATPASAPEAADTVPNEGSTDVSTGGGGDEEVWPVSRGYDGGAQGGGEEPLEAGGDLVLAIPRRTAAVGELYVGAFGLFHTQARRAGLRGPTQWPAVVTRIEGDRVSLTIFAHRQVLFQDKVSLKPTADEYFTL